MSCAATLKEKGMKLTPQRMAIIDVVHDNAEHVTAEEIIAAVQLRMPQVDKSTVYRTLEILEKAGCIYKSEFGEQYIYHHAEEDHHHHLVCSKCGKTVDCDESVFAPVEHTLLDKYNFRVDFKHLVISGLCDECRKKVE